MGLRTSRSAEITFTDCEVPEENRLGEEGAGPEDRARSCWTAAASESRRRPSASRRERSKRRCATPKQRRAFGKTIGDFQAIQWMLADMQTEIEAARALVHQAAWMRDTGAPRLGPYASRAKLYAGEMVNRVVYKAVQIHGSLGYSRESDVERMYRDARVITIYEGTSEIQRMIIARDLLGRRPRAGLATRSVPPARRRP